MTVKELREILEKFPDDMEIWIKDVLNGKSLESVSSGPGFSDCEPRQVVYLHGVFDLGKIRTAIEAERRKEK